jgi:hypothetical protein
MPVPLLIFAALAYGLHVLLTRTPFGLRMTMYGANPLAALLRRGRHRPDAPEGLRDLGHVRLTSPAWSS